ncbi:MAG TPA: sulfur reduction protein DsrE [Sphaerochaeta sp.]|nr:sulfur reduction protein DsrE [Sphaerochaeta sp.]
MSSFLMIFNHAPYDGTDVTWNALRLAGQLESTGHVVRIFLMNDSVDLARDSNKKPIEYDQDLSQMLRNLIAKGVQVKVCGTCMARCGIHKQEPYFEGTEKSTMAALAQWTVESDKLLTF